MSRNKENAKRDRLIVAANNLIYQQSFHNTTLADIAKLADVPLGNVYYYFKTKAEIILAVLDTRQQHMNELLNTLSQLETPTNRLAGLIDHFAQNEHIAAFGCSYGTLCQELSKQNQYTEIRDQAASLMAQLIEWVEKQICDLGCDPTEAKVLAESFMTKLQGICLITLTFHDQNIINNYKAQLLASCSNEASFA